MGGLHSQKFPLGRMLTATIEAFSVYNTPCTQGDMAKAPITEVDLTENF